MMVTMTTALVLFAFRRFFLCWLWLWLWLLFRFFFFRFFFFFFFLFLSRLGATLIQRTNDGIRIRTRVFRPKHPNRSPCPSFPPSKFLVLRFQHPQQLRLDGLVRSLGLNDLLPGQVYDGVSSRGDSHGRVGRFASHLPSQLGLDARHSFAGKDLAKLRECLGLRGADLLFLSFTSISFAFLGFS